MAEQAIITTAAAEVPDPEGVLRPGAAVAVDYAFLKWEDITRQPEENRPTQPNQFNVLFVCEESVMNAIDLDPNYVIQPGSRAPADSSSDTADDIPSQAQFDSLRAEMLAIEEPSLESPAWTEEDLDTAIGTTPNDRSNRAVVEQLTTYCRNRRARRQQKTRLDAALLAAPGRVGYRRNEAGTLQPTDFEGNQIQQIWTDGGEFVVNLRDPIINGGEFTRIRIGRPGVGKVAVFKSKDGSLFNNNTAMRWSSTFEFQNGQTYRIDFVE